MFKRPHHQRIARVLQALDGPLRGHSGWRPPPSCWQILTGTPTMACLAVM